MDNKPDAGLCESHTVLYWQAAPLPRGGRSPEDLGSQVTDDRLYYAANLASASSVHVLGTASRLRETG